MPPTARIGSLLLAAAMTAQAVPCRAQVYVPEPNDGPMTRVWLDAQKGAPAIGKPNSGWEGRDPSAPEERLPAVESSDSPPSSATNSGAAKETDPLVTNVSHEEAVPDQDTASGGEIIEPKLLRSANAIPLRRPDGSGESLETSASSGGFGLSGWITVGSSLAAVLGLFFVFAWFMRRSGGGVPSALPREAVEVLGRSPLGGNRQMQVIRFGNKVVLVAVSPEHVETLAEINDPVEVEHLIGLCKRALPGSASLAFQKAFRDLERTSA